jgi:predicted porin
MKKLLTALVSMGLFSTAYAGSFEGPYVGAGAGGQYTENKNMTGDATGTMSDSHFVGQVTAGYGYDITPHFNITVNGFLNLSNDKVGSIGTVTGKTKNNIGISLEPGYYLNKDTLAYVKIGYTRLDSKLTDSAGPDATNITLNGILYGAGVKYHIDKNIFVGAEVVESNYGSSGVTLNGTATSYKTNQTQGLVNIGYQF